MLRTSKFWILEIQTEDDRNNTDAETTDEESSNITSRGKEVLIHCKPMFHFLPPKNIRKLLLFLCFQGARNRTLIEIS